MRLSELRDWWHDDRRAVQRVWRHENAPETGPDAWPSSIPAVRQLLDEGLEFPPGVTFLVGENGSGKSTLVEAIAIAWGLSPEGGSPYGVVSTRPSESPLHEWVRISKGPGAPRWGFFLRAETMHNYYTYLEANPGGADPVFHEMSHGESFLSLLQSRINTPGFYCLDEPEAALSFTSTLAFMRAISDLAKSGSQIICSTHSPILASLSGAQIIEVGEWGMRVREWKDLELVSHWRAFLNDPNDYLRHLLPDAELDS